MKRRFSLDLLGAGFLRSYVAIVLGIIAVALALDSLLLWFGPGGASTEGRDRHAHSFALIDALVLTGAGGDARDHDIGYGVQALRQRLPDIEAALGLPVAVLDMADFAGLEASRQALEQGEIVPLFDQRDREVLYRRIPDSDHVLALGPLAPEGRGRTLTELLVITAYYVLVAIVVLLWIRPFYRDLAALRRASAQFGKEDFSTRIALPASSGILPVAQSFNAMAARIQHLVSAHRELTSAVSHELRTPLARFKFSLQMLGGKLSAEKQQDYLQSMKQDVLELESLTDELLSYARLSERNLELRLDRVDLGTWLRRQVDQYSGGGVRIEHRFESLRQDGDTQLVMDPDLMARAVHNVLRNCLRYASEVVTMEARLMADTAELRICDDGPGIPQDMRERVFEPFSRLDTSRDRQSGGHGLGLAIAQRVLQRHLGGIRVEDHCGGGACFVLWWPCTTILYNSPTTSDSNRRADR